MKSATFSADSDEENRLFRADDDQIIAERDWQNIVTDVIVVGQGKGSGVKQQYFVSMLSAGFAGAKFA